MAPHLTSIISVLPLGLLALIAWRAWPQGNATPAPLTEVIQGEDTPITSPENGESSPEPADPSLRQGYADFKMEECFVRPAGPHGLEYTAPTRALDGARVRTSGWMVRHLHDDPKIFLLNVRPMALIFNEYGLADDLPPFAPHVVLTVREGWAPVWTPVPLEVCGRLELGPRQEKDGRISHVRLFADHVLNAETGSPVDLIKPIGLQPARLRTAVLASPEPALVLASPPPAAVIASPNSSTPPSTNTHQ